MPVIHGGKTRIGLQIAKIIESISEEIEDDDFTIKGYCEPFCGMLGVFQHIPDLFEDHKPKLKYKAADVNESVIKMWKSAKDGWKPKISYTRKDYDRLKNQKNPTAERGFVGHSYTYRGIEFGGYFNHTLSKRRAHVNRVVNLGKFLKENDVVLKAQSYSKFSNLKNFIIYCDPPYQDSEQRYYDLDGNKRSFDSKAFWNWCRKMSSNNIVIVSEYKAPSDFKKLYEKTKVILGTGNNDVRSVRTERLFMYKILSK